MLGVGRAMRKNRLNKVWKMALNAARSPKKMSQDCFRLLPQEPRSIISENETVVLEKNSLQEQNRADFAETMETHQSYTERPFPHIEKVIRQKEGLNEVWLDQWELEWPCREK